MKFKVDELQITPANPKHPLLVSLKDGNVCIKTDYPDIHSQAGSMLVFGIDGSINHLVLDHEGYVTSEVNIRKPKL
jgi:hypothetical protein